VRLTDAALLACTLQTTGSHVLQQTLKFADTRAYVIDSAEVRSQGGLPFRIVDLHSTQLLARADGTRALAEIARDIATAYHLDPEEFTSACAGIARRLIASGFLVSTGR
jgi:hypothetical protein